ncbi:MAG TPA: hypothetical protein VIV06_10300 [Candidatus Limnocylindrales bacterium]
MNEADRRFADRLAEDLERVLRAGVIVDEIESLPDGRVRVRADAFIDGRIHVLEAVGESLLDVYRPLVRQAAEARLNGAFWQIVGPS